MNTVTIRNMTLGAGKPKICIPITAKNREELLAQTENIRNAACDMVEWRADFYGSEAENAVSEGSANRGDMINHAVPDSKSAADKIAEKSGKVVCERSVDSGTEENVREAKRCDAADRWNLSEALSVIRAQLPDKPLLFTFRTKEEGGERSISRKEYRALNEWAASSGMVDLVDLELNRGEELLREATAAVQSCGVAVIGSFHDFEKTPEQEQIIEILCRMQELGADITKAAVMPRSEQDVLTILEASLEMKERYADRPYITMSMGRLGAVSRLSGFLTGAAVTFATAGRASAPGQMDAELVGRVLGAL